MKFKNFINKVFVDDIFTNNKNNKNIKKGDRIKFKGLIYTVVTVNNSYITAVADGVKIHKDISFDDLVKYKMEKVNEI